MLTVCMQTTTRFSVWRRISWGDPLYIVLCETFSLAPGDPSHPLIAPCCDTHSLAHLSFQQIDCFIWSCNEFRGIWRRLWEKSFEAGNFPFFLQFSFFSKHAPWSMGRKSSSEKWEFRTQIERIELVKYVYMHTCRRFKLSWDPALYQSLLCSCEPESSVVHILTLFYLSATAFRLWCFQSVSFQSTRVFCAYFNPLLWGRYSSSSLSLRFNCIYYWRSWGRNKMKFKSCWRWKILKNGKVVPQWMEKWGQVQDVWGKRFITPKKSLNCFWRSHSCRCHLHVFQHEVKHYTQF